MLVSPKKVCHEEIFFSISCDEASAVSISFSSAVDALIGSVLGVEVDVVGFQLHVGGIAVEDAGDGVGLVFIRQISGKEECEQSSQSVCANGGKM